MTNPLLVAQYADRKVVRVEAAVCAQWNAKAEGKILENVYRTHLYLTSHEIWLLW